MPIPAPDLDDRRFQDFVDDAKRLLQRRLPAWTDHNVHDPGVTLIEAVATIADQLTFRVNQVTERQHRALLDLLGVTLAAPTAARADLTFRLSASRPHDVSVPAGTVVSTPRVSGEEPVTFTTLATGVVPPVCLVALRSVPEGTVPDAGADLLAALTDAEQVTCLSPVPRVGDQLLIGLDAAAPRGVVALRLECAVTGVGVDPVRPPVEWEAATATGWQRCDVDSDGTGGLNTTGDVVLHLPAGHEPQVRGGVRAAWIRMRVVEPAGRPVYSTSPVLRGASARAVGVTVPAAHMLAVAFESLGTTTGAPGETFTASRAPLLDHAGTAVDVAGPGDDEWVTWTRVAEFSGSGPDDPQVGLDPATGTVTFGPAVRRADGSVRAFGRIPAAGSTVRLRDVRRGGGARGNVGPGRLCVLHGSIPYVREVVNRSAASGGRDGETVDEAKVRAGRLLHARDRAVTAADYVTIAEDAAERSVRVHCIPPVDAGAPVRVLVVPDVSAWGDEPVPFEALEPRAEIVERIADALEARRLVGVRVAVEPPRYTGVTVAVRVRARDTTDTDVVREQVVRRLYHWLHPWWGGADGAGWPLGRPVTAGDVHAALVGCVGLDYVEQVRLFAADPVTGRRVESDGPITVPQLPYSFRHQAVVS